jgi:cytochrome c-type biogenesis protein CcmF
MNLGQTGNLAVLLTLAMIVLSGGAFFITAIGIKNFFKLGVKAYYFQIVFATLALAYLWYLFFSHDFTIAYVYGYSSSDLSFFYLLSALWAGQEGTYLLWLFFSSLIGLIIIHRGGRYKTWGIFFYSLVNLFLIVMLLTVSPFKPLDFIAVEGAGLNPLLQDPWMVIHPPVMFIAYAIAGLPFAIVMAAMIKKDYSEWLAICFPYIQITALTLGIANVLGGFWAYKTLGWGGYWSWDPVENTSFIPWVISLSLIHSTLIEKKSGALRRSNLLLTALVFVLVVYGTFLTRSGVLADFSVHSFVDLGVNIVLISFILLFVILTLVVFLFSRGVDIVGKPLNYNVFSKDFILYTGMVMLFVFGVVVLFWSSLPLITGYLMANPAAAEISTYNAFAFPLTILLCLILTLAPFHAGKGLSMGEIKSRSLIVLALSVIFTLLLYIFTSIDFVIVVTFFIYVAAIMIFLLNSQIRKRLLISLAFGLAGVVVAFFLGVNVFNDFLLIVAASAAGGASFITLWGYFPGKISRAGGHLSHVGFTIMVIGILASSAFSTNETVVLPLGEQRSAFDYGLIYWGMTGTPADENNALDITLNDHGREIEIRPRFYYNKRQDGIMKKPYIKRSLLFDLYLSPQNITEASNDDLIIRKGETMTVDSVQFYFDSFEMESHSTKQSITVGVRLEVEYNGQREIIVPTLVSNFAAGTKAQSEPVELSVKPNYKVALKRVFADQRAVSLSIIKPNETTSFEKLVVDVSIKPGINFLWSGTFIIFIGMLLSIYRRFGA